MSEIATPTRTFIYGQHTFGDPGPAFSIDAVKAALAATFPEIANAQVVEKAQDDGQLRIEFVKQAGEKG